MNKTIYCKRDCGYIVDGLNLRSFKMGQKVVISEAMAKSLVKSGNFCETRAEYLAYKRGIEELATRAYNDSKKKAKGSEEVKDEVKPEETEPQ